MFPNSSSGSPSNDRPTTILKYMTTVDRCPDLWVDGDAGGLRTLLTELAEQMSHKEAYAITMFVECLADHLASGETTLAGGDIVIDLARGHHDLNQFLAPTTLEKAEANDLIEPARVYDGWGQTTPTHIARRTLWDLGSKATEYLDLQAIRGYDEATGDLRSDANEGMAHRFLVRLAEHVYHGQDEVNSVRTYVRAGALANVDNDLQDHRYDLVALTADGSVHATCEAELKPVDRSHVVQDATLHAHLPGDSDWAVWRKQEVNRLLDTLVTDGAIVLPDGHPGWSCLDIGTGEAMARLQRVRDAPDGGIARHESEIVTSVNSADNLREVAQTSRPAAFQELDF